MGTALKKKLLIVSSSLSMGGLEKCLISLCDSIDYQRYDVELYLFNEGRELLPKLNKSVRLLPDSPYYAIVYNRPLLRSCVELLKRGQLSLLFYRIGRTIRARLGGKLNTVKDWQAMRRTMLMIQEHYHAAIGFEEGTANYYVTECVDAEVKSCWIHTDINKIGTNELLDRKAFTIADHICTVSNNSVRSLKYRYPEFSDKYRCFLMPALQDTAVLLAKAVEPCVLDGIKGIKILSVGRLVELKGFHLCVPALRMLLDLGYDVTWFVAGEGDYRAQIEELIERYEIKDRFVLLGNCGNPYSLMRSADICVQPSSYEGFGVAVWEEKALGRPVIASDIPTNHELLTDGVTGLIIERSSGAIFTAVKRLIDNADELKRLAGIPTNWISNRETVISCIEETWLA